ncbi:MAG: hypothetical protein AVDCRST_MAG08-3723, partial [uncultured Acetobacteraceae bacterium]
AAPLRAAAAARARGPIRGGAVQRPHERVVRPRTRSGQVARLPGRRGGLPRLRAAAPARPAPGARLARLPRGHGGRPRGL